VDEEKERINAHSGQYTLKYSADFCCPPSLDNRNKKYMCVIYTVLLFVVQMSFPIQVFVPAYFFSNTSFCLYYIYKYVMRFLVTCAFFTYFQCVFCYIFSYLQCVFFTSFIDTYFQCAFVRPFTSVCVCIGSTQKYDPRETQKKITFIIRTMTLKKTDNKILLF